MVLQGVILPSPQNIFFNHIYIYIDILYQPLSLCFLPRLQFTQTSFKPPRCLKGIYQLNAWEKTWFKLHSKKKRKKKTTSNKKSWRIQDMFYSIPCTVTLLKRLSNRLRNAKKTFSEHHQVWDPPSYAECFEVKEHKDAPAKQLFALVFMCGDPSPLPWMTTMAWWSLMAMTMQNPFSIEMHWKRSNLPSKMKIIVIMAPIVIIYYIIIMLVIAMMISDGIQMMLEMIFGATKLKKNSNHSCPVSGLQCLPCHWREHKASNTASRIYIYIIYFWVKNENTQEKYFRGTNQSRN